MTNQKLSTDQTFSGFQGPTIFERVMSDLRKNVLQTDFERKKHANKFLGEKYPALKKISLMTYNAEKNLTPLYVGEKISNLGEVWEKILPIQTKSVKSPIPIPFRR